MGLWLRASTVGALLAGSMALGVPAALASGPCGTGGVFSATADGGSCRYSSAQNTGLTDTFTVPAGVNSVTVVTVGGMGGNGQFGSAGGFGESVTASVPVTGSESLSVNVAGNGGEATAGFGGGGAGGAGLDAGGGGGGASSVSASGPLVVAGGGGGGGSGPLSGSGGNGGQKGSDGAQCTGSGGGPGVTTPSGAVGQGGTACESFGAGSSGQGRLGGAGGSGHDAAGGGGGGGGYFGGGGGSEGAIAGAGGPGSSNAAGGGGGASYSVSPAVYAADTTGTPSVTISYGSPCGVGGVYSLSGTTAMCAYAAADGEDIFAVPSGLGVLDVTADGARGGSNGAPGAQVADSALPVPSGTATLFVDVGEVGGPFPDAGAGSGGGSGGGGGSSDLLSVPWATAKAGDLLTGDSATDARLLAAGGGGGAGVGGAGGDAGQAVTGAGAGGCEVPGSAGGVGPVGGTAGGGQGCANSGTSVSGGAGGNGGGGGGGGWFGGGGGASGGGGGGGSSYGGAGPAADVSITTASSSQAPRLTISWTVQTITFPATGVTYGQADFSPASAPGGTVTYTATSGGCAAVDGATQLQITAGGSCTATANQAGGGVFAQAAPVTQTFPIAKAAQQIEFTSSAPTEPVIGGSYAPAARASSAQPAGFSIDPASAKGACSIRSGLVSFTGTGSCVIDANQAGNGDYLVAPRAQQKLIIGTSVRLVGRISVRSGKVRFTLACAPASQGCKIAATLTSHGHKTVASVHATMRAGARHRFSLALGVRGRGALRAVLKITLTVGGHGETILTRTITR
jgi:hypothetical protein